MSRRIPFICGSTKGRDHFQFRRDGGDLAPYGDAQTPDVFGVPSDIAQLLPSDAIRWLWKVKKWGFHFEFEDVPMPTLTFGAGFTFAPLIHAVVKATGDTDADLLVRAKTGPVGTHAYLGAVDPQPECADERELLDDFRDDSRNVIFTRGNFGHTIDKGAGHAYQVFFGYGDTGNDALSLPATADWTGLLDNDDDQVIVFETDDGPVERTNHVEASFTPISCTLEAAIMIRRFDPPAPALPTGKIRQHQLYWDSVTGKIGVPMNLGIAVNVLYHLHFYRKVWDTADDFTETTIEEDRSLQRGLEFITGGAHSFDLDGVAKAFRWFPGADASTASGSLNPTEYWPFLNRLGQPVYDETTGAQVNDPFA
jgi:hypothetical protein